MKGRTVGAMALLIAFLFVMSQCDGGGCEASDEYTHQQCQEMRP